MFVARNDPESAVPVPCTGDVRPMKLPSVAVAGLGGKSVPMASLSPSKIIVKSKIQHIEPR